MNVVAAAVGSLAPKLLRLLEDEYKLQRGVKKKVKSLSKELEYINPLLCKVSDVPWDQLDDQVKVWASEIREASYHMEDILDTFLVRVEGRESTGRSRLKRALNEISKWKARHDVGCAIRDIMKQLQEVAARHARYRIEDIAVNSAATTSTTDPRLKAMYNEVASLVGVDEPSKVLISKLSARQEDDMARRRKIVSIFGTGGLGKTTLAKAVYDKIRADFECGAFVPVGRNPNLARLLMDILYELDKNKFAYTRTKETGERQLIDNLREFLGNKRYFIVIDDIWENKSWKETIELALLDNNCGSRIIITTRNAQVANEIGDEVYRMQPLSDDNSKKLFYTRTFDAKEKWLDNEPDEISKKILKKCDGVPLAIITMASLLVGKPREKWSDVFTSVGFGHKEDEEVDNTMKILSFSYYDLPAYLRTCLLYLSVYAEDHEIDRKSLIWKWIAEGFIQGKPGIWLFGLGEQYFNDLVNRSMIQVVEYPDDMVWGCRVHDMVLDLIRSISSEENFVTILDNDEGTMSPPPRTARRLALHYNTMEHTAHGNMKDMPQVRSFIAFGCALGNRVKLSSFKLLRVLDMERCKNVRPSHLVHLENLSHLRYLGLGYCEQMDELPNEIGALKLLQTLNLEGTRVRQLTPSISLLTQLVCLKCHTYTLAPNWIGKLTSLEELQVAMYLSDDNKEDQARGFLKALGSLRELRLLECEVLVKMDESMQRDLMLSVCNLHKLRHLNLRWVCDPATPVWEEAGFVLPRHLRTLRLKLMCFSCLPPCIGAACLPFLTSLSLIVAAMDQKGLEFLGRLPELCYLELFTESTATISNINASNSYFQKLRSCLMTESMIQFRCKEDSSVSFHVWNGIDAIPFGSSKNNCSVEPYAVMPNLEKLSCRVFVRALKDGKGDCGNIGFEYLPSLWRVRVDLRCEGASAAEVDEAEAALRKAAEVHPNRPMLQVGRWCDEMERLLRGVKDKMISAVQDQKTEDDDVSAEEEDYVSVEEEDQKQQEGELTADEGVTKSSILNS